MSVYLSNNGQVTQEPHLNAKTTFPKMTIFGTVIEVPLLAEAMTANLSQVPDQSILQVPPAPPQQPPLPMPPPLALDAALPLISAHLSKLERVLASRSADWYINVFDAGVFAHRLQRLS